MISIHAKRVGLASQGRIIVVQEMGEIDVRPWITFVRFRNVSRKKRRPRMKTIRHTNPVLISKIIFCFFFIPMCFSLIFISPRLTL